MSERENKNVCDVCGTMDNRCGSCGHSCGFGGGYVLRWVLGILIITWIFCIGMRFGEIKAHLESTGYGYNKHYKFSPMPMMGGATWSNADQVYFSQGVPVEATITTSAVKTTGQ